MHIGRNVTETLWLLLEPRMEKDKIVKGCKDIQERNREMKYLIQFHSNIDQVNINSISMDVYGTTKKCCQRNNVEN